MANGEPHEKILDRIEAALKEMDTKINHIRDGVVSINISGCAQRGDDLRRIEDLEKWRTRGIIGFISMLAALVYELFKGLFYAR